MERQPHSSTTTYHENGRARPAEVFEADPWPRRRERPWLRKLRLEWEVAPGPERFLRVWWWTVCAVGGFGLGVGIVWLGCCVYGAILG